MDTLVKTQLTDLVSHTGVNRFDEHNLDEVLSLIREFSQSDILTFRCLFSMDNGGILHDPLADPLRYYNILDGRYKFDRNRITRHYRPNNRCIVINFSHGLHEELLLYDSGNQVSPCGLYCDTTYYKVTQIDSKKAFAFMRLSSRDNDNTYCLGLSVWRQI